MRTLMNSRRSPRSAGILFALLPLGGAIVAGSVWREPVIGLLAGLALATVLVALFYLGDRRR